ncbi:hypothetical protein [Flavobacterium sp. K5-23]|uniref:hypothetical protein n=1 Tax=Flavobacterium sp. K5-23 TaxID=2746225 RepID=UPI00200F0A9C|nr:hypothetical protein [Flavobacterium sp. K5-23]UQD55704.1 hypothetical protein FLAK523_04565 [Flavobacterium sp. K5-23]
MNPSDKTMVRFYQQLGKLFYGIASVDKNVREEEIIKLKEIIKSEWLPLENTHDIFGSDSAYQIEIVFDWLVENDCEMDQVLIDLDIFKKIHSSLFTPSVNELILKTANAIAKSFARKNKSEHVLISRISELLSS